MRKKLIGIVVATLLIITMLPVIEAINSPQMSKIEKIEVTTEKSDTAPVSTVAYAQVYTNKFIYHLGEPVDITFYNKGPATVALGNGMPMYEIQKFAFIGFQWQFTYPQWVHPILIWVHDGTSRTETWDQTDLNENPVKIGIYRVDVPYYEDEPPILSAGGMNQQVASDYFLIIP